MSIRVLASIFMKFKEIGIMEKLKNFRFKGTAILFLIFVVLFAFVLLFEKKRPTKTAEEAESKKETFVVWDLKKDDIQKFEITFKDKIFEIAKEEDKWQVTRPSKFEAKKEKIDELLENLAKIEGEKKITGANLSDFGLDKPRLKAKLLLKDGKQFELLFGDDNPEKTKIYAKRADENYVFLVDQSLKSDLEIKEENLKKKEEKK